MNILGCIPKRLLGRPDDGQCFGHLLQRAELLEKTLMLGKIEGKREKRTAEDELVR